MDLIDASNAPVPVTVDPITGNTLAANGGVNVTEDTQMADREAYDNAADDEEDYITDNASTSHDFKELPPDTKAKITRLLSSAGAFWDVASLATPFPAQYLPDPDCHRWGFALISRLNNLADLTRSGHKGEAVECIVKHMKERNDVPGNTEDENIPASVILAGDFVIRLEDVNHSLRKMRSKVNSYRPAQQGQYRGHGRGGNCGGWGRGRGRGGRARG